MRSSPVLVTGPYVAELADQAEADPSQIIGLAELAAAFDNIDADDPDPDELEDLFESIFTGGEGFTGFDG